MVPWARDQVWPNRLHVPGASPGREEAFFEELRDFYWAQNSKIERWVYNLWKYKFCGVAYALPTVETHLTHPSLQKTFPKERWLAADWVRKTVTLHSFSCFITTQILLVLLFSQCLCSVFNAISCPEVIFRILWGVNTRTSLVRTVNPEKGTTHPLASISTTVPGQTQRPQLRRHSLALQTMHCLWTALVTRKVLT